MFLFSNRFAFLLLGLESIQVFKERDYTLTFNQSFVFFSCIENRTSFVNIFLSFLLPSFYIGQFMRLIVTKMLNLSSLILYF
jgi:hypothetical protein